MKMEEIILEGMEVKSTHPFAIYFVYAPEGNFVLKGRSGACEKYIAKHFSKCLYNYTYWHNGESRGGWRFNCKGMYVDTPSERQRQIIRNEAEENGNSWTYKLYNLRPRIAKYEVFAYFRDANRELHRKGFEFRRMPRKWIPEFDMLIDFINGKKVKLPQFWSLSNIDL